MGMENSFYYLKSLPNCMCMLLFIQVRVFSKVATPNFHFPNPPKAAVISHGGFSWNLSSLYRVYMVE